MGAILEMARSITSFLSMRLGALAHRVINFRVMDSMHWTLAQMEKYFAGEMPDDEHTAELVDHLADCPACSRMAGAYAKKMENAYESSDEALQALATQSVAALRDAAESQANAGIAQRLRRWVSAKKSWGAIRLEVTEGAVSSEYENLARLVGADALQLVEAHAGRSAAVRVRRSIRTRGSSARRTPTHVEVSPARDGKRVSIRWSGFPQQAEPLIALFCPSTGKADIQRLVRDWTGTGWLVRFDDIPDGPYVLLVEQMR
jgi:hypothetical protein